MRFASIVASILIAASAAFSATNGIIGTPTTGDGNNRPSITGVLSTVITAVNGDTIMFGAARDSVTAPSNSYRPWPTSLFNVEIPNQYQGVASNKDSLVFCVVGAGDADTTQFSAVLQGRAYGSTNTTNVWVPIGAAATMSFLSNNTEQVCATFRHPGTMDFRFRGIASGTTDTTDFRRFSIYDK